MQGYDSVRKWCHVRSSGSGLRKEQTAGGSDFGSPLTNHFIFTMENQIFFRETKDEFEALILANIMEKHGGEVFSVTHGPGTTFCWKLWTRIHRDSISLVDKEYGAWLNSTYGTGRIQ